jgi:anti-sigma factor RsiW
MAERTHIPGSAACGEWETLLADALDGLLKPDDEATFTAHMAACAACAALYEEARMGREWLEFLSPEPEAPAGLLEKILAHTGPGRAAGGGWAGRAVPVPAGTAAVPAFVPPVRHPSDLDRSLGARAWQQQGFLARMRYNVQPRLLMTAAMAFFSIALTLNMAGVRLTNVRLADLRPQAVRSYMERQLAIASVPIVRYYDHSRFVYEVESRVRELRREGEGEGKDEQRKETQPMTPGQTRQNPGRNPGWEQGNKPPQRAEVARPPASRPRQGTREQGREHPGSPAAKPASGAASEFFETSLEQNQNSRAQAKNFQGGFFFHPCDEDLSLGTPEMKKPLRGRAIGYSYSGSAVVLQDGSA